MNSKIKEVINFNQLLLANWLDNIDQYPDLLKLKRFKNFKKTANKLFSKRNNLKDEDYQDFFYNLYELIYKKYLDVTIIDYFEELTTITCQNGNFLNFVWELWFSVNTIQWWWFQIANNIDFENKSLFYQELYEKTYNSLIYCISDALVMYSNDMEFKSEFSKNLKDIKLNYKKIRNYTDFTKFIDQIKILDPQTNLTQIITSADEEMLDRYVFCEIIFHFKKIIEFVEQLYKN